MKKNPTLFLLAFIAFTLNTHAQNGQSDVRLVQEPRENCSLDPVNFTIEVKAASQSREFFLSEQNYRFSFNDDVLINPRIVEELTISGAIVPPPVPRTDLGYTAFSQHNLTGSLDTVVSYNVELSGGDGYYLNDRDWVKVGRIQFDVIQGFWNSSETRECYNLVWHRQDVFPPTFVGEIYTENGDDERANTTENYYGNASSCLCVILPVELIDFTGEERNCENHLTWETATETNSDYFVVERSSDAVQFSEIGRVDAAGNSLQNTTYDFVDSWAGTTMYYRLKQVDIDGGYEYFDLIRIDSDCYADDGETPINVFPNPISTENDAFIQLSAKTSQTISIDIINVTGVLVSQIEANISDGPNLLHFPTDNLAVGTYFIRVRGDGWFSSTSKFVKLGQ